MTEPQVPEPEHPAPPSFVERHRSVLAGTAMLLLVLFIFLMRSFQIFGYTSDDTFVALRYASHVSAGDGLVWNRGERPATEGFTSILWILMCALPMRWGADAVLAAKLTGLASTLFTAGVCIWVVTRMGRKWISTGGAFLSGVAAAALVLLGAETPVHAVSGTEAAPAMLLLTLFLLLSVRYVAVPRRFTAVMLALAGYACILLRPEFLFAALPAFGAMFLLTTSRRDLLRFGILPLAAVVLMHFVWRAYRTWMWLPIPMLLPGGSDARVLAGVDGTWTFLRAEWPLLLLAAGAIGYAFRTGRSLLASVAALFGLLIVLLFPAHHDTEFLRPFVPLAGILGIFAGLSVAAAARRFPERWAIAGIVVALTAFFVWQSDRFGIVRSAVLEDARVTRNCQVLLGKALADVDPRGFHTVAVSGAPATMYYSRWNGIDLRGLNDREIALHRRAGTFEANQVIGRHPDLLAVDSRQGKVFDPSTPDAAALREQALRSGFRPAGVLKVRDTLFLWLMTPNPPFARTVTAALERRTSPLVR